VIERLLRSSLLLALLLATGCASNGPRRVPLEELPADYRRALQAYREQDPRWPELREAARTDAALAVFLADNLAASMIEAFAASRVGSHTDPVSPFRRAQNELVAMAPASTPVLVAMVRAEDPVLAHLGAETLRMIGPSSLGSALALLDDEEPRVRRRGAELLGAADGPSGSELEILARLASLSAEDEDWLVRAQAVRGIGERVEYLPSAGAVLQALSRAAGDPESLVAAEAARALGRVGELDAGPPLIRLLDRAVIDADLKLWRASQDALVQLAGGGPDRDARQWRAWLQEARAARAGFGR
jgi:HEAT repeat protein